MKNLVKILAKKKLKIAFAESCTGGMLAAEITSVSGASKVFSLGLVTYSNQAKISVLKINKSIIQKYGAVSPQCCQAMVKNLAKISKTQINVSITGIAGPNGGTKSKPVGLVYMGIKTPKKLLIKEYRFKSKVRNSIQRSAAKEVVKTILKMIS